MKSNTATLILILKFKESLPLLYCAFQSMFTRSSANMMFSDLETSQYYFVLKVLNKAGFDIFIKCTDGVPKRGFAIKKGFIVVITKLTNSVTPVGFSASDIHGKPVLLNGKSHLTLTPSTVKREPMKITVQNAQGKQLHFTPVFHDSNHKSI